MALAFIMTSTVNGWTWQGLGLIPQQAVKKPSPAMQTITGENPGENSEQVPQNILDDLFKGLLSKSTEDATEKNLMKEWENYM